MADVNRSEILDNIQKKKEQEKEQPQASGFQQQPLTKPSEKPLHADGQGGSVPVNQHVASQQLLSPTHGTSQPLVAKEDTKDKSIKVANSTTITLIENGNVNVDKDKDNNYPKNYFTLEPKNDKKDDGNKNSITITRTVPKQSPGSAQVDKSKGPQKPTKRPLQCLETLAEKAGITFEDKYEAANTLLALDKQNNSFRRPAELKQPKAEPESNNQSEEYRYRSQKEEDDKLQIQQQIIQQQQQQQQHQQLQQFQQQQLQQLQQQQQLQQIQQQQALHRQHQQAVQQHFKNQQDQQELLQKQFQTQQQQKPDFQQVSQHPELQHQKFLQFTEKLLTSPANPNPPTDLAPRGKIRRGRGSVRGGRGLGRVGRIAARRGRGTARGGRGRSRRGLSLPPSVVNNQPVHTQQFNVPGIGEINLSFLPTPQNNVNLLFDKNQKTGMSAEIKPQQIVENQAQVVQQQMSMAQHESPQQHHQTVTVVSSMPSSMAQHQVQQQQATASGIQQQAGVSTMPPLQSLPPTQQHPQQISAEWGHSRVQVIQQPLQNSTYLQQLYNAQGPLLMPGNIALHPGINSQQIQVIAAGKPFQGNQLAPHMLTAQGKPVLQGQTAPFPGYTTIPAIPTTQNQTFVFSPLGVINSQSSILPAHSQPPVSGIGQHHKPAEMHKVMSGGKVAGGKVGNASGPGGSQTVPVQTQCVQVSQPVLSAQQPAQAQIISPLQTGGQAMQFAPWQISGALSQVWAGGLQTGGLPTGGLIAPNPILIRGTQPDAPPSMFIQHSPQNNVQHNNVSVACATGTMAKPRASTEGMNKAPRPLSNILPSSSIRPASSVSTQTANQAQNQAKHRGKPGVRSPAPASKQDAANQTNKMQHQMQPPKHQLLVMTSTGQMAQMSVDNKQALNKSLQQQQAILQQQAAAMQAQQAQQQQLMHQQQTQQLVHHYQHQGMALGMQQGTLPVGSVAQTLPIAGMPQTISMLGSMAQPGTLVGQINTSQPPQSAALTPVQSLQQQPQTLVGSGLVQTTVGMGVQQQQPSMTPNSQMQTPALGLEGAQLRAAPLVQIAPHIAIYPEMQGTSLQQQLTLQTPTGTVGLIAAPAQGSIMPLQPPTTLLTRVKQEDEKSSQLLAPAPSLPPIAPHPPPAPQPPPVLLQPDPTPETTTSSSTEPTPMAPPFSSTSDPITINTVNTSDAAVSTSTSTAEPTKTSSSKQDSAVTSTPSASELATPAISVASSVAPSVASTSQQTTPVAPQVITTTASSTSAAKLTAALTAPMTSGAPVPASAPAPAPPLFKNSPVPTRHMASTAHDKGLPKAMVKPNILTHVIEGYVIQEAGEPFAVSLGVNRPLRDWSQADKDQDKENKVPTDEPPRKKQMLESGSGLSRISSSDSTTPTRSSPRSPRSSESGSNSGTSERRSKRDTERQEAATAAANDNAAAAAASADGNSASAKIPNANKWTVAEVCDFIRSIPGCASYADEFLMQEVDGEALLLIKPEHLVMALSMKLGPALKIVACIDSLRPESEQTTSEQD